jgi:hypothetical protein
MPPLDIRLLAASPLCRICHHQPPKRRPKKPATISDAPDIWTLDEKLKHIKSPELRAALRRLGGPVGDDEGAKN